MLTNEQRLEIIAKYNDGMGCTTLGKEYGVHENSIIKLLKSRGVEMRPRQATKINKDDAIKIAELYKNGMSVPKIAQQFNASQSLILKYLEREGVERRSAEESHRIYPIHEDFFDNIDTQEKAYFLGILYADGGIQNKKSNYFTRIELERGDKDILYKLSALIFKENPDDHVIDCTRIRDLGYGEGPKEYESSYLVIHSKHIVKKLIELGCCEKKSLILKWPEWLIDSELQRHFIRGYYDGDGGVNINEEKGKGALATIVSTINMCENMDKIIKNACNTHFSHLQAVKDKDVWRIYTAGNRQVKNMLNWLYKDSTIHLERKYKLYQDLLLQIQEVDELAEAGTQGYSKSLIGT